MKKQKNKIVNVCVAIGICLLIFYALIPLFMITGIWDYFIYNKSVSAKEDVFRMVEDNQEEFEKIVEDMKALLEQSDEDIILLDGRREYRKNGIKSPLFKKYPIYSLSIKKRNGNFEIFLDLTFCPKEYSYWGIYYVENDNPSPWYMNVELEKKDTVYIQEEGYFKYETEKITDHWYYYQCRIR